MFGKFYILRCYFASSVSLINFVPGTSMNYIATIIFFYKVLCKALSVTTQFTHTLDYESNINLHSLLLHKVYFFKILMYYIATIKPLAGI